MTCQQNQRKKQNNLLSTDHLKPESAFSLFTENEANIPKSRCRILLSKPISLGMSDILFFPDTIMHEERKKMSIVHHPSTIEFEKTLLHSTYSQ